MDDVWIVWRSEDEGSFQSWAVFCFLSRKAWEGYVWREKT